METIWSPKVQAIGFLASITVVACFMGYLNKKQEKEVKENDEKLMNLTVESLFNTDGSLK